MREERQRYLRRTAFFALPAVDAGIGDVRKAAQVEHRVGRDETRADHLVWLLPLVSNGDTDRTMVDARVTLHAPRGLPGNGLPEGGCECIKVVLAPLVTELVHCILNLGADLDTLGVCRFRGKFLGFDCSVEKFCTLLAADLDKGRLAGLVADDTPVPAGKIRLPGDLHLAAAAVRPAAVAGLFELIHGDTLVASLVLDDELALVDLFLGDRVRVDAKLFLDHPSCSRPG